MPFNLFGKKDKAPRVKDLVWMHSEARKAGTLKLLSDNPQAITVSWFEKDAREWQSYFDQHLPGRTVHLARQVRAAQVESRQVIILGHYPLLHVEQDLLGQWNAQEIIVCNALDEPLFKRFGGDKIIDMMKKMGMKEDEVITHSMITSSIRNAQEKLDKHVANEMHAGSAEEWFSLNGELRMEN